MEAQRLKPTSAIAALALGSNLPSGWGTPADALREALRRLERLGELVASSSFHETDPVGYLDQPRFVNAAALLQTRLPPRELLHGLLAIEAEMGRVRAADQPPKGPRLIDLDLLLYCNEDKDSLVLSIPELNLPHPAMDTRRFVLEPLAEIAPAMVHPVLGKSVAELLAQLGTGNEERSASDTPGDGSPPAV